jgi:hypothetical protein
MRANPAFGAVNYATLTLRRGMTSNFDLWIGSNRSTKPISNARGDVTVTVYDADGTETGFFWSLPSAETEAPPLNRQRGVLRSELQLA